MSALAAVVFDFDGLVIDTEWCEYVSVAEVFADHGVELPLELWLSFIGTLDHPHWADILEATLGHGVDRDTVVPAKRLVNRECAAALDLLPGVMGLLDALGGMDVPLAVASSSPREWVLGHLEERGLTDRFEAICTGDEVPRTKPDPALYRLACERLRVDPAGAVAIEDSIHGIRAATDAGMATVAVPSRLTAGMDFSHADLKVGSCAELTPGLLAGLVAGAVARPDK